MMLKKSLVALSAAAAMVALPTAAQAQYGGYSYGYGTPYYGGGYQPQPYYGGGYGQPYGGYNNGYYDNGYYGGSGYRCGNGTTGAIVGGLAGAVIGSKIARSTSRNRYNYYGYRRGSNGTTGALIGGAIGAVVGSKIAQGNCR